MTKQDENWEHFMKTGSVQDYLNYCNLYMPRDIAKEASMLASDNRRTDREGTKGRGK